MISEFYFFNFFDKKFYVGVNNLVVVYIGLERPATGIFLETPFIKSVSKSVIDFLEGKVEKFSFEYELFGTEFQKKVWEEIVNIPYGSVKTYKEIGDGIGSKAYQAIGTACSANDLPFVVPCHRVVGGTDRLNYSLGGPLKEYLLELEEGRDNIINNIVFSEVDYSVMKRAGNNNVFLFYIPLSYGKISNILGTEYSFLDVKYNVDSLKNNLIGVFRKNVRILYNSLDINSRLLFYYVNKIILDSGIESKICFVDVARGPELGISNCFSCTDIKYVDKFFELEEKLTRGQIKDNSNLFDSICNMDGIKYVGDFVNSLSFDEVDERISYYLEREVFISVGEFISKYISKFNGIEYTSLLERFRFLVVNKMIGIISKNDELINVVVKKID